MLFKRLTFLRYGFRKADRKEFMKFLDKCPRTTSSVPKGFYSSFAQLFRLRDYATVHTSCRHGTRLQQVRTLFSHSNLSYIVNVKTGDQRQSGTDANVKLVLHSESGKKSEEIALNRLFRDDFEQGQLDTFQLKNLGHLKDIHKIEVWRDDSGLGADWYVDYVEVEDVNSRKRFMFPLFRWIKANKHYLVRHMDNCLPQFDEEPGYRHEDLVEKRKQYQCATKVDGAPAQVSHTHQASAIEIVQN